MPFATFLLPLALLLAPETGRADALSLTLAITGTAGMRFGGDCVLDTGTGPRPLALEGTVPRSYALAASGLTCRIRKEGRNGSLTVEVRRAGDVVSSATVAGGTAGMTIAVQ